MRTRKLIFVPWIYYLHSLLTLNVHLLVESISPINAYILTLGFLLATPENRSALNLHEKAFYELLWCGSSFESSEILRKELTIIERLLTSTNNRINKSSSLWCIYRKLFIVSREVNLEGSKYVTVFIQSASRHFSNYYCWAALRWFFDVVSLTEKEKLFEATETYCFQNIKDASSWSALSYIVCQQSKRSCFNVSDYERLVRQLDLPQSTIDDPVWLALDTGRIAKDIITTIDTAFVAEWPPFLCLLAILNEFPNTISPSILEKWSQDISSFENKHSSIYLLRNNPSVPASFADDLLKSSCVRHLGYKKLFLQKLRMRKSNYENTE